MKKIVLILFVFFISLNLIGCGTMREKFTRKPKEREKPKAIFASEIEVYPAGIRYSNHFIYWRSWQGEMIQNLGGNHKKVLACADRALYNLGQMSELLVPAKQEELKPYLDELEEIATELHAGYISEPRQRKLIRDLENHVWNVRREFDYQKMKEGNWIKQD
jgi:hypothetical protein